MSSNLLVCCMNYTWPDTDISLLRRSADRVGINLLTWGDGRSWPSYGMGKIEHARDFLKSRPEELVLYTDGTDSFICASAPTIIQGWERAGSPGILLQAEKNCYPEGNWASEYPVPASGSPWRYICAGGWMGRRTDLIQAFDEIMLRDLWRSGLGGCDQRDWTDWWLRADGAQQLARLDTECQVFQSAFGTDELDETGRNTLTGTWPSVFHFNGRTPGREELYARLCP